MAAGKKYPEQVYIEEEKNEKYMEGNYDGDAVIRVFNDRKEYAGSRSSGRS
ncbi:MAG: hypothetical protein K2P73_15620 [Lachnospiraceae bacterium]|nr:hypothetical protein [Lachnospiraceae bacterium]